MTTKNSEVKCRALKCRVPKIRKPKDNEYNNTLQSVKESVKLLPANMFNGFIRGAMDGLPAIHTYPPYGQPCFQQAYAEMQAVQTLATTYTYWINAQNSGYMPPYIYAMILAAFVAAKANYLACWGAMEDCLNMIV